MALQIRIGAFTRELKLKSAVTDLKEEDFKRALVYSDEERVVLADIDKKMDVMQQTTMQFTNALQNMNAEKIRLEQQIEHQFQTIFEQLLIRKHALLQDVGTEVFNKQAVLSQKIETFLKHQSELSAIKQTCLLSLSCVRREIPCE